MDHVIPIKIIFNGILIYRRFWDRLEAILKGLQKATFEFSCLIHLLMELHILNREINNGKRGLFIQILRTLKGKN